jgi:hypothetical protein
MVTTDKQREYAREYYKKNPDKIKGYHVKYSEHLKEYYSEYRKKNSDKLKEYRKYYYENVYRPKMLADPELYNKNLKRYHREDVKPYYKEYYQKNKEIIKEKALQTYREKKMGFFVSRRRLLKHSTPEPEIPEIKVIHKTITLYFN